MYTLGASYAQRRGGFAPSHSPVVRSEGADAQQDRSRPGRRGFRDVGARPSQARAQLGSGWTQYSPPETLQIRGCAAHSASGGVDQFRVTCATMGGDNRAEHRTMNDYSSGTNQFEGEIRVVTSGTNIIVEADVHAQPGGVLHDGGLGRRAPVPARRRRRRVAQRGRPLGEDQHHPRRQRRHAPGVCRRRPADHEDGRPAGRLARQVRLVPLAERPWPRRDRVAEHQVLPGRPPPRRIDMPPPPPPADAGVPEPRADAATGSDGARGADTGTGGTRAGRRAAVGRAGAAARPEEPAAAGPAAAAEPAAARPAAMAGARCAVQAQAATEATVATEDGAAAGGLAGGSGKRRLTPARRQRRRPGRRQHLRPCGRLRPGRTCPARGRVGARRTGARRAGPSPATVSPEIALAQAGFAHRSQSAGGAEPYEGSANGRGRLAAARAPMLDRRRRGGSHVPGGVSVCVPADAGVLGDGAPATPRGAGGGLVAGADPAGPQQLRPVLLAARRLRPALGERHPGGGARAAGGDRPARRAPSS